MIKLIGFASLALWLGNAALINTRNQLNGSFNTISAK